MRVICVCSSAANAQFQRGIVLQALAKGVQISSLLLPVAADHKRSRTFLRRRDSCEARASNTSGAPFSRGLFLCRPAARQCWIVCCLWPVFLSFFFSNRRLVVGRLRAQSFARQADHVFLSTALNIFPPRREGSVSGHLLRPFFGTAAIEQSPHCSLMRKEAEFKSFRAILWLSTEMWSGPRDRGAYPGRREKSGIALISTPAC